ncbi:hypothetical protein EYF80_030844 [Liparis tanakae]|uniref:Uncharacterized protein n=1 Tax=Liparis tanakae TaxID=230148 RepID=A0A4Z2H016_9TELE|nr:hypothetical protein EYF80_030844 [Liparis tanakae]
MRREAELGRGAALLAQGGVGARRLGPGGGGRRGVLPLGVLLLLLVAGQAEEEAEDGFQIAITDLCGANGGISKREKAQAWLGLARPGSAWLGLARPGSAWLGLARVQLSRSR